MQEGHILTVLQVTPELSAGGVERTTLEMAEAISRAGGLALVASAGGRLEPDLRAAGGELIQLPAATKNPITAISNAFAMAKVVRERGVQIVHARSRAPAWSALAAARMTRTPFLTTFHGIYNARSSLKRLYNSVMARGDLVIANSEYTRQHVIKQYNIDPARVIAIPRGVDLEHFDPVRIKPDDIATLRSQWGLAENDKRIVFIIPARLTRWKGHLVLIEAIKHIEAKRPGALKLIIAGDAQGRRGYHEAIVTNIEANKLQDVVAVVGHVRQMPLAFAASDVAVFPSIEPEAFGRGAVEAQAMGVPVIASNLGGFTETVVEGETGFLVPAGNVTALATAMERFIDLAPETRVKMGQKGRDRAQALYSKEALQTATLAVYERLLREAKERKT
ncbi:glycosyltransferase family 4 protein [Vitreimonas flagellata]|uniref:glycosyltransferase family 4 protein n=1 Tax=Vitreimonas flagellata TaxID=2560861 RepID=UPI001EF9559A|nr:glycosyltransferase family 4 protein [Vitreimonas flagellata]